MGVLRAEYVLRIYTPSRETPFPDADTLEAAIVAAVAAAEAGLGEPFKVNVDDE